MTLAELEALEFKESELWIEWTTLKNQYEQAHVKWKTLCREISDAKIYIYNRNQTEAEFREQKGKDNFEPSTFVTQPHVVADPSDD